MNPSESAGPSAEEKFWGRDGNGADDCAPVWAGWVRSNIINLSSRQDQIFSSEGVDIFPVKPNLKTNYGPHQYFCSSQGLCPVKAKEICMSRVLRTESHKPGIRRVAAVLLLLVLAAASVLAQQSQTVFSIRVIGNRRIPKETVLARLFTHQGDTYDPLSVERDFNSLWNTGYFEDLRIEREDTEQGIILNVFVREKPTIREINYKGLNAVSVSDVLDRFKKEKVGLTQESQYDPTKVMRAVTVLRDILAEHGHQFAVIKPEIKTIPPASVQVNFNIKEGPTVKVGEIKFTGNEHINSLLLRRAMKNLRPIGIPYSIFLRILFRRPSTHPSWKRTPRECGWRIATRAITTRRLKSRRLRFATRVA